MPKATVNGIGIHYQHMGRGPTIVFIHGLAANLAFWYFRILPRLVNDYSVVAFDLRGHGHSDMPPSHYTSADMARDVCALLDQLGVRQSHIVGHSFGGVVALHFAALYPDRTASLTIADSRVLALQPSQKLKDWPYWVRWKAELEDRGVFIDGEQQLDYESLPQLFQWMSHGAPGLPRPTAAPGLNLGGGASPHGLRRWSELLASTTAPQDFRDVAGLTMERIQQVNQPTLAIYGEHSFALPTCRRLGDNLPNCRVVTLPGVGHFFPALRPLVFLRSLRTFLSRCPCERA
jgi:pimeloyl-ACP methyl ester carboxylesterase